MEEGWEEAEEGTKGEPREEKDEMEPVVEAALHSSIRRGRWIASLVGGAKTFMCWWRIQKGLRPVPTKATTGDQVMVRFASAFALAPPLDPRSVEPELDADDAR